MDQERARTIIVDWSRSAYGHFLEVREVKPVRKAKGRVWAADLYCMTREGDVHVGQVVIDEQGKIIKDLSVDLIVDALAAARTSQSFTPTDAADEDFGNLADDMDFSDLTDDVGAGGAGGEDQLDTFFGGATPDEIQERANWLIATGEQEKLLEARELLPQLLNIQERRGTVLHQMAELEMLLGELEMGIRHLEASAREYTDLGNLDGLAMVAELAAQVMDPARFEVSAIRHLFEQTRLKLRPLDKLREAPLFVGLGDEELFAVEGLGELVVAEPGEVLLREGDLANMAFIIKSGTLAIQLESADGPAKVVRTCFPGDFIGESSVLGEVGATCTATVMSAMESELWHFDGQALRGLCDEYPEVKMRIESAKTLHQLDSFISMNESTATLDVSMRDQLLSCISGIARYPKGTVLNASGAVPTAVYLIVNGQVEYRVAGQVARSYDADAFAGLRDALHELPLEGEFVAVTDCLLVVFSPDRLQAIAHGASPEVIAVLEKLE